MPTLQSFPVKQRILAVLGHSSAMSVDAIITELDQRGQLPPQALDVRTYISFLLGQDEFERVSRGVYRARSLQDYLRVRHAREEEERAARRQAALDSRRAATDLENLHDHLLDDDDYFRSDEGHPPPENLWDHLLEGAPEPEETKETNLWDHLLE